jgi:hypothetical protein
MIAIHNVVAASSTVGPLRREGQALRMTIIPTTDYLSRAGLPTLLAIPVVGVTDARMLTAQPDHRTGIIDANREGLRLLPKISFRHNMNR